MTVPTPALLTAQAEAAAARTRFLGTLDEVRDRLAPRSIVGRAWEDVREKGEAAAEHTVEFAIAQPRAAGAIAAGVAVFVIRKPIVRGIKAIFRRKKRPPPTPAAPELLGAIAAHSGEYR